MHLLRLQIHNANTGLYTLTTTLRYATDTNPPPPRLFRKTKYDMFHCSGVHSGCLHCIASETWSQVALYLIGVDDSCEVKKVKGNAHVIRSK